jgi:glycerol transport system substrate-binding protein
MAHGSVAARRLLEEGMKLGYQDAGSWTLLKSTPDDRAKAAWLYAQFVTSKTVDVKKSHVGLTFIREADDPAQVVHRARAEARRPDRVLPLAGRVQWSPTGTNVPDYPKLAQLWWQNIGDASSGAKTPQEAMDSLCAEQEKVLERLERPACRATSVRSSPKSTTSGLLECGSGQGGQPRAAAQDREREGKADHRQLRRAGEELAEVIVS